jgi:hypothetical protein
MQTKTESSASSVIRQSSVFAKFYRHRNKLLGQAGVSETSQLHLSTFLGGTSGRGSGTNLSD